MTDKRIKPAVDDKNSKELALEKLSTLLNVQRTNEEKSVLDYKSLKIPDNNPFKRRTNDELHLDLTQSGDEVSVISDGECEEISCATPDNLILKSSKKRKLNVTLSDKMDNMSQLTQESNLGLSEQTPESQNSISSKRSSVIGRKRAVGKENQRKNNRNSSGIQKNSILNFFSRV